MLEPRILKEKHLKLRVVCGQKAMDAIGWGMAERGTALAPGQSLDMAFTLDRNVFQDTPRLQLVMKDVRSVAGACNAEKTEIPNLRI